MENILQFFWLFCGAWTGLGNACFFRYRLREPISRGLISKEEADRFAVGVACWIGGPCAVFWILQFFFAQTVSPFFLTWDPPFDHLAGALCVLLWIISFVWIWFFGGDRKLSRICTLTRYQTYIWQHPFAFRVAILLAVAGGILGMTMHDRTKWTSWQKPNQPSQPLVRRV